MAFSPWLCLTSPHDERRQKAYGTLHVFVDRADGLPAADLNGLSDPYVTLQLNDQELQLRTVTRYNTLAPKWAQDFYVEVYRPESILTLPRGA